MIDLYTAPTPNGWKASVTLEELELPYQTHPVDLSKNEQREEWFLRLNPNGRIPVIVDGDADDLVVFESGAIMLYLPEKTGRLIPKGTAGRFAAVQWLMFQMGGVGPMMGQANVFFRYFPEKIPSVISRYQNEGRRLFEVLDRRLSEAEWLADEVFTIADIANWCWATNDLQTSNVPGIREDVYLAGARIERSYGFGPLPGCAAMITLVSHGDTCCIAANVDPAAVTEIDLFAECLSRGFSEVVALHPGSRAPVPLR